METNRSTTIGVVDPTPRPAGVLAAGGILDRIVQTKTAGVRALKDRATSGPGAEPTVARRTQTTPGFAISLSKPAINIIAEIKHRSPSKGIIRPDFDPLAIAASYVKAGAAALSVLTEEDFFGGSITYLEAIRRAHPEVAILRKDFIFDEVQLEESRTAGADAVLLIVAILDQPLLVRLIERATELGLDALVEVHNCTELERAIAAHAKVVGVNNRDLTDFSVSLETSTKLGPLAPPELVLVSESGIAIGEDVVKLRAAGFNAFLVGEHFMRSADPGSALQQLVREAEQLSRTMTR